MDEASNIQDMINFTWSAIGGGVYYDSVKSTLGKVFKKLESIKNSGDKQRFEDALTILLESNDTLLEELRNMRSETVINNKISTGDIISEGHVVIGSNNKVN